MFKDKSPHPEMITIKFMKTGRPHRTNNGLMGIMRGLTKEEALAEAYATEPLVLTFDPIVVKGLVINHRKDLSRDVVLRIATMLSNG